MQFISKEILDKISYTSTLGQSLKQCFNDILGFRLHFEEYPETYPDYFRVVDLRKGKKIDDGYRAIHLYYQRNNLAYPIEIQLWCSDDYLFNVWSHKMVYKYYDASIGKQLYEKYKSGIITSKEMFINELEMLMKREVKKV